MKHPTKVLSGSIDKTTKLNTKSHTVELPIVRMGITLRLFVIYFFRMSIINLHSRVIHRCLLSSKISKFIS